MTIHRIGSDDGIDAPGFVEWAIKSYLDPRSRAALVKAINQGWGVDEPASVDLLSEAVPYFIEGDTVVFRTVCDQKATA